MQENRPIIAIRLANDYTVVKVGTTKVWTEHNDKRIMSASLEKLSFFAMEPCTLSGILYNFHSNSIAPVLNKVHRQSALLITTVASAHTLLLFFMGCSDGSPNIFQIHRSRKIVGRMKLCARWRMMKTLSDCDGKVRGEFNEGFRVFPNNSFCVRHPNPRLKDDRA